MPHYPKIASLSGLRKGITEDWRAEFPGFGVYKSMWLARRIGPVVQGLCLDRSGANDSYRPHHHFHCLANPFECIPLSPGGVICSERNGATYSIRAGLHGHELPKAVQALRNQTPLTFDTVPSPDDLIRAYRNAPTWNGSNRFCLYGGPFLRLQEDLASVLAWYGRGAEAEHVLHGAVRNWGSWEIRQDAEDGPEAWLARELERVRDLPTIIATVEHEVRLHKLQRIPKHLDLR